MAGSAASAAETRKHVANDEKCSRLGWVCIPLSVETYVVGEKKLVDVLTDSPCGLPHEQAVPSLLRCLGFMED